MTNDARALAAESLRELGHAVVGHDTDAELLREIAATATQLRERVMVGPERRRDLLELKRQMFDVDIADGERISHFADCFVSGAWNPLGIAMDVRREGDEAVADVTLGLAFEGAPGRAHGGIVAALCDDIMGYILTLERQPDFTGTMTVQYHEGMPIQQPLQLRARVVHRDGRKLEVTAEATAEGRLIASSTGTFITVGPERFRAV